MGKKNKNISSKATKNVSNNTVKVSEKNPNIIMIDPKDPEWKLKMRTNYKACLLTKEKIKPQGKEQEEYLELLKNINKKREERNRRRLEIAAKNKNKTIPTSPGKPIVKALSEPERKELKERVFKTFDEKKARDEKFNALRKARNEKLEKRALKQHHHKEVVLSKKSENDTEGISKNRTPRKTKKVLCVTTKKIEKPVATSKTTKQSKKNTKNRQEMLAKRRIDRNNRKLKEALNVVKQQKEKKIRFEESEKKRLAKKLAVKNKYNKPHSNLKKNENNEYIIRLVYSDKKKNNITLPKARQTLPELQKRLNLINETQIKEYKGNDYIGAEAYLASDASKKTVISVSVDKKKAA